jgi:hypothetical protein
LGCAGFSDHGHRWQAITSVVANEIMRSESLAKTREAISSRLGVLSRIHDVLTQTRLRGGARDPEAGHLHLPATSISALAYSAKDW